MNHIAPATETFCPEVAVTDLDYFLKDSGYSLLIANGNERIYQYDLPYQNEPLTIHFSIQDGMVSRQQLERVCLSTRRHKHWIEDTYTAAEQAYPIHSLTQWVEKIDINFRKERVRTLLEKIAHYDGITIQCTNLDSEGEKIVITIQHTKGRLDSRDPELNIHSSDTGNFRTNAVRHLEQLLHNLQRSAGEGFDKTAKVEFCR